MPVPNTKPIGRRFVLYRDWGIIAEGICFHNGICALTLYKSSLTSTSAYDSLEDMMAIYGDRGKNRLFWLDVAGMELLATGPVPELDGMPYLMPIYRNKFTGEILKDEWRPVPENEVK